MIVTEEQAGLRLVTQPDHARLARSVLGLWRSEGVPERPRRRQLLVAVGEHDNGWQETDAAPRVDPRTGRPVDFRHVDREERITLWRRGVDRLAATPYVAALVAHHAVEVHADRPAETWGDFRRDMEARREQALDEAEIDFAELAADYRYLDLCDTISLIACGAFSSADCRGYRIRALDRAVEIDPFPLAGATSFSLPERTIAAGPYRDAVELGSRLAAARWTRATIRLVPAAP